MVINEQEKKLSLDLIIQIVIALGLMVYAGYRAAKLDLVYDEACSYFWYARDSLWEIYLGVPPTVNNHWLNSFFMKVSIALLGPSELAMRWHSVLALGAYLAVVIAWLRQIRDPFLRLAGFLLLACNPYILDFFSLARGYGLAMTFTVGGTVCLCRWVAQGNNRWGMAAVACGIAAVLSNLCALLFLGAILAVIVIKGAARSMSATTSWKMRIVGFWERTCWAWWGTIAAVAFLSAPILRLAGKNSFYAGGQNGFWRDTVQTIVCDSLYRVDYGVFLRVIVYGIEGVVAGVLVIGFVLILSRVVRKGWGDLEKVWAVMFILLVTAGAASIFLHVFVGVNYLADRLATFLLPLFMMTAVILAHTLWPATPRFSLVARGLAVVVMLACGAHFVRSANTKWTYEWRYDSKTREVLGEIQHDAQNRSMDDVKLGVSFLFHPSFGYYREVNHLTWLAAVEKDWDGRKFDYYYIKDGLDVPMDAGQDLVAVKIYPDLGTRLLRRARQSR
jgi:hypothetical protein